MSIGEIYTLTDIRKTTGESQNLLTFLLRDRQIPHRVVGTAKVMDENGKAMLLQAIADYNSKAELTSAAS